VHDVFTVTALQIVACNIKASAGAVDGHYPPRIADVLPGSVTPNICYGWVMPEPITGTAVLMALAV
jgi:hypothetical protein